MLAASYKQCPPSYTASLLDVKDSLWQPVIWQQHGAGFDVLGNDFGLVAVQETRLTVYIHSTRGS